MEQTTQNRIKKIVVLGAESTGKSILCEQLAKHYHTVFVPEYARIFFEKNNIHNYTLKDLEHIAKKQLELESTMIKKASRFLFCDTSLITIKIWSNNQFGVVPPFIEDHISKEDYDLYLLCNNDTPWIADDQRLHPHLREQVFKWNKDLLNAMDIKYKVIKGVREDRLKSTIEFIDHYFNR